jgi:hypothetical protein
MTARARLVPAGLLTAAIAFSSAGVGSAQAGLIVASASSCPAESLSQVFLHWGDTAEYGLIPGGKFAAGSAAWTVTGSAKVVAGGDGYALGGSTSTRSLSLPAGSSGTSPQFCVGINSPTVRTMVRNTGAASSSLAVSVVYETSLGTTETTQIAAVTAGATWVPTSQEAMVVNLLPLLPGSETPVELKFSPTGSGGGWQIDDAYVDPMGRD